MQRALITALLPLAATSLVVAGGVTTAGAGDTTGGCALPAAERSYTRDQLVYRLALDLTDCDWWDGSPVQLDATVERVDPTGGHGTGSFVMCAALTAPGGATSDTERATSDENATVDADDGADVNDATPKPAPNAEEHPPTTALRSGLCAVEVSVDHPSPEAAHYTGEITFPWQGERRTVSFNAFCGGAAGCVDLPVNPMASLAPLGEAIVGIGDAG